MRVPRGGCGWSATPGGDDDARRNALATALGSGPTWVALLGAVGLGSVRSAAITAASLIYQNKQNNEREVTRRQDEAAEREKDREAEARARLESRLAAREDHWRDKRLEAAKEFLDCSEGALLGYLYLQTIQLLNSAGLPDPPFTDEQRQHAEEEVQRVDGEMRTALYEVLLLGGDESRSLAHDMATLVKDVLGRADLEPDEEEAEVVPPDEVDPEDENYDEAAIERVGVEIEVIGDAMDRYHDLASKYRRAVRAELGTRDN